jgi:hypothetical protein
MRIPEEQDRDAGTAIIDETFKDNLLGSRDGRDVPAFP